MGGAFAPNQRFVDFALSTIEFHRANSACSCLLYTGLETYDPQKEVEKGNVKIVATRRIKDKWVDYYRVRCYKCKQTYKVLEREHHYTWWSWTKFP